MKEIKITLSIDGKEYSTVIPEAEEDSTTKLTHYCSLVGQMASFISDEVLKARGLK